MLFLGEREVSTGGGAVTFLRCEVLLVSFELAHLEEQASF